MARSLQQHPQHPTVNSMDNSADPDFSGTQSIVEETRKLFQHQGSDADLLKQILVVIDCMNHLSQKPTSDRHSP